MEFGRRAKACYTNQVVAALFEELPPHPAKIFDSGRAPAQELQLKFALRPDSSVVERGPEKAGVGGSIPSLATTKSTTYKLLSPRFHSNSFQLARRDSPRIEARADTIRFRSCDPLPFQCRF
jgi:hypothetical protein